MNRVQPGDVLIADMTDPDWEPVMKRASAIVTNRGGRTCHAAIIARELGVPAVVGSGNATKVIEDGQLVTVSCAEDHDERGQPGTCLRLRPAAERRHRPGPPGNDHRQPHRHPPERAAGVRPPGRGDQEEDRREDRRLR
ncbi:hypothetical protein G6F50_015993 [Rhizopus delemar]|uniref:PEP-utilising enzyme mobile domain-containing protein n=1 Tax=Rhizopus delemar TaxID=936053 RepID=A0A9P6XVI4_9FUNG|nr:hypothetical protein G6F50_015993 [Rhizopus delemar]